MSLDRSNYEKLPFEIFNTPTMKICQTVQKQLESMGYTEIKRPFHNSIYIIGQILINISVITFLCEQVADTGREIADAMFMTATGISVFISYLSTVQNIERIFIFINEIENLINESEYHQHQICHQTFYKSFPIGWSDPASKDMFEKTNMQVKKLCKIAYFAIVNVSIPCITLPEAIYSYFIYYTTNLGGNAFELSIPFW